MASGLLRTPTPVARRFTRSVLAWLAAIRRDTVVNQLARSSLVPDATRRILLRNYGMRIGRCTICPGSWFGGSDITIGDGTFVNRACTFDNSASIHIGERCGIGMQVTFVTSTHRIAGPQQRLGPLYAEAITVGDGAWIGTGSTLLPGTNVGAGCVVAAGSVVRGDCVPHSLYAGVPAEFKRRLDDRSQEPAPGSAR
jgi:maltose O-acetyltransferase